MPEFPCPRPITVKIKLPGGSADVYAEERDTAVVEVAPYDPSGAADAAERTVVEMQGDTLVVEHPFRSGWLPRHRERVRVRVFVPVDSSVVASVASADLACHGRFAAVNAKTASGNVSVDEVTGDLAVDTASGDVRAGAVGRLGAGSASGDLRVSRVGGDAKASSASGDLEIEELGGALTAITASGDIRVGVARRGAIRINAASGDVSVGVAAGTRTWLDLSSTSGSTTSDLAMTGEAGVPDAPSTGEAGLSVQVRTMSGDVRVHRVVAPATS
jgi:DUF4097 and DUF4098 domain-containing protein YvlB